MSRGNDTSVWDSGTILADGLILNKPLLANGFWLPPSRASFERMSAPEQFMVSGDSDMIAASKPDD
jgi:hypothetical protein